MNIRFLKRFIEGAKQGRVNMDGLIKDLDILAKLEYIRENEKNPAVADIEEIISIIQELYPITLDILRPFVDNIRLRYWMGCYNLMDHAVINDQMQKEEYFQIKKLFNKIKSGLVDEIDFKIVLNKGQRPSKQIITISSPEIVSGLINYLQSLPRGNQAEKKRGQPPKVFRNTFIRGAIRECIEFLKSNTDKEFSATDQLYFAGLILALIGAVETPGQHNEPLYDYRIYITDWLKHYK